MTNSIQSYIELFHLRFLQQLAKKLDKKLYALKGGCNLRFYFKSIRYSEDIDFDVSIIAKETLENKITKILNGDLFKRILLGDQIAIIKVTSPKQTETTQRWKVLLRVENSTLPIHTKIEFSRRTMKQGVKYEAIDEEVIRQHKLYPTICNHYDINTAFLQKIDALINRTETQARDIFDLDLLINKGAKKNLSGYSKEEKQKGMENAKNVSFTDFTSQVVAYLMDEYKELYASSEKWNEMKEKIIKLFNEK